jgi:predicted DNA-binding WGR domain protein
VRRFERQDGQRRLYWEVEVKERFVHLVWGEVGGPRRSLERNLGTPDGALRKMAELIDQQRRDGYVELESGAPPVNIADIERVLALEAPPPVEGEEPPPPPALTFASSPELERECLETPDDRGPWEIYGDWLISQDDIRGEIAALQRNHKDRDATRLIAQHYDALFGRHAGDMQQPHLFGLSTTGGRRTDWRRLSASELAWRHGFLRGACLVVENPDGSEVSLADYTRSFLAAPIARFVDQLRFGIAGDGTNDWGPTLRVLADSIQAPYLRELRFDAEETTEVSWIAIGELDGWSAFPRLEHLRFRAGQGGTLGTLDLPALRSFEYMSTAIGQLEIESIAAAAWPSLERLELWLGAGDRGAIATIRPLQPILDGTRLPVLRHLGLVNSEHARDLIDALARSPLLPRLRSLDLSRGTLYTAGELLANAAAFTHLESIALGRNYLSDDDCDRIRNALPNANVDDQRLDETDEGDAEDAYRFVDLWE